MYRYIAACIIVLCCMALAFGLGLFYQNQKDAEIFRNRLLNLAKECVCYNDSITQKEAVLDLLARVEAQHYVLKQGGDDLRVPFVFSQGCIEHVLACSQALGEIKTLISIIHTPMPATPMCTEPDPLDTTLLDESIRHDIDKLLTVHSRAFTVRAYLNKGGTLYAAYPRGGLEKRSPEQQKVYRNLLQQYPMRLIDWVLETPSLPTNMVGATYFIRSQQNNVFVFSIQAPQANNPQDKTEWGLWFGEIKESTAKARVDSLFEFFATCKGPSPAHFQL